MRIAIKILKTDEFILKDSVNVLQLAKPSATPSEKGPVQNPPVLAIEDLALPLTEEQYGKVMEKLCENAEKDFIYLEV